MTTITISRGYDIGERVPKGGVPLSEWTDYVSSNPRLAPHSEVYGVNVITGKRVEIQTPHSARLDLGPVFSWNDGFIVAEYFEELLPDYREIAAALDAGLFGEEGERL